MFKSLVQMTQYAWGHPDLADKGQGLTKREGHLWEEESLQTLSGYTLPENKDIKEFPRGLNIRLAMRKNIVV